MPRGRKGRGRGRKDMEHFSGRWGKLAERSGDGWAGKVDEEWKEREKEMSRRGKNI